MLYEIMKSINNFFEVKGGIRYGEWVIDGGTINLPFLQNNQFYLIKGSIFNDGLHQYGKEDFAQDEYFSGSITPLAIPTDFIKLANEIKEWQSKNGDQGVYQSESFNGYSYTKATGSDGEQITWQSAFKKKLSAWRKL